MYLFIKIIKLKKTTLYLNNIVKLQITNSLSNPYSFLINNI